MSALGADPRGLLVDAETADDLQVETGDAVEVILALGTKQETRERSALQACSIASPDSPKARTSS